MQESDSCVQEADSCVQEADSYMQEPDSCMQEPDSYVQEGDTVGVNKTFPYRSRTTCVVSLVPRPLEKKTKRPGIHCLRACGCHGTLL